MPFCHSYLKALRFLNQRLHKAEGRGRGWRGGRGQAVIQASCFHNCKAFFPPLPKTDLPLSTAHSSLGFFAWVCLPPRPALVTHRFTSVQAHFNAWRWRRLCTWECKPGCGEDIRARACWAPPLCSYFSLPPVWLLLDFSCFGRF